MSSENEIVNQAGDDEPENEPKQLEHAIEPLPEPAQESDLDAIVDEDDDLEDDWEAWIETNPEEEEVLEVPVEPVAEPEPISENEVELVADVVEVLVEVEVEVEPEPVSEATVEEAEEAAEIEVEADALQIEGEIEAVEDAEDSPEEPVIEAPTHPAFTPQNSQKLRRDGLTTEHVITYFAPCGRCGYFLSGYRALYGGDDLETAVSEAKSGWLTLTWGIEMQHLILKSYGSRIEMNDLHFDGCCSECRRAFVYKSPSSENKPATFRIEIKPRKRQ